MIWPRGHMGLEALTSLGMSTVDRLCSVVRYGVLIRKNVVD